ncbi:protein phosphatase 2C domain-containing protein [Cellulomonas sp. zg-ZUI188]|uniref:Protein phosphatase 2C domain-containing protein n=1 Tax=Cellulomonas fengjieae TaxID=2819978 RepID=A0ABS3SC95_9CELL|nr:protein phosphatase 2C domain-containing protein [Cellulomonas fengjieae]MBO3101889.1 protein phosphatase 2C domain-containing protein [Cellulomonas fengjieae]QVI67992.1 protein phosphatase 2C domain-containing protein [Cellulomonas fengjieae]
MTCSACGTVAEPESRFCEHCGTPLGGTAPPAPAPAPAAVVEAPEEPTVPVCRACGGTIAADGYCEHCGEPAVNERDHWSELPSPLVGGVCDRGRRHTRNEDAMALGVVGTTAVLVVCDGVSTVPDSDIASLAAARAARDVLSTDAPQTVPSWSALLVGAAASADTAITEAIGGDMAGRAEPPSCTFVAAVVDGPTVVAGWLGDSRVYWLPDEGQALQVSVDDSAANEMIARGVPRATAEASREGHAITRWLGPDAQTVVPSTATTRAQGPGWVLVCSDGLWNYCSEADDVADLVHRTVAQVGTAPDAVAAELVRWANAQGGHDNITAALARVAVAIDTVQTDEA